MNQLQNGKGLIFVIITAEPCSACQHLKMKVGNQSMLDKMILWLKPIVPKYELVTFPTMTTTPEYSFLNPTLQFFPSFYIFIEEAWKNKKLQNNGVSQFVIFKGAKDEKTMKSWAEISVRTLRAESTNHTKVSSSAFMTESKPTQTTEEKNKNIFSPPNNDKMTKNIPQKLPTSGSIFKSAITINE